MDKRYFHFISVVLLVLRTSSTAAEIKPSLATSEHAEASPTHVISDDDPILKKIGKTKLVDRLGDTTTVNQLLTENGGTPKLRVFFFMGIGCPATENIIPTVNALEEKFRKSGVVFAGVSPQPWNSVHEMSGFAMDYKMGFPIRKDLNAELAQTLGATKVPSVVVLDSKNRILYSGAIDDTVGQGRNAAVAKERYLENALSATLDHLAQNKPLQRFEDHEADGCSIEKRNPRPRKGKTFNSDIAPILKKSCSPCHRPGGPGSYSFLSLEDIESAPSETIREVLLKHKMPPSFHENVKGHKVVDPYALSDDDRKTLLSWLDTGMEPGEGNDVKIVNPGELTTIGRPQQIFVIKGKNKVPATIPENPDTRLDLYVTKPIHATNTDEMEKDLVNGRLVNGKDTWITATQTFPGAASATHQAIGTYSYQQGDKAKKGIFAFGSQGLNGISFPEDVALRIPDGALLDILFQYKPHGKDFEDATHIGIKTRSTPPKREATLELISNTQLKLLPYGQHQLQTHEYHFEKDGELFGLAPLAHARAKDFEYTLIKPDGTEESILRIPRYDSHFRKLYQFEKPIVVPKGSVLKTTAHYDNSANNPNNPDPSAEVNAGTGARSEQMDSVLYFVAPFHP